MKLPYAPCVGKTTEVNLVLHFLPILLRATSDIVDLNITMQYRHIHDIL